MQDMIIGFALAFPSALLLTFWFSFIIHSRNNTIGYDVNIIKEDLQNLIVKLSAK